MGALYHILPEAREDEIEVENFTNAQGWDEQKLGEHLPEEYVLFVMTNIPPPKQTNRLDKPFWMLEASGNFSVRSAWNYIRQKDQEEDIFKNMWSKKLPFKQSFFLWSMWKFRVPVDEVVQSMGINIASRCWCCTHPKFETMSHLFLTSDTATKLWRMFANVVGIHIEGLQLSQVGTSDCCPILKPLMIAVPTVIIWNLWKRRNSFKHGRPSSYDNLVFKVNSDLWTLGRCVYPKLQDLPAGWSNMVAYLEKYKPKLYFLPVSWKPIEGILKCNTDCASRGNPGRSTYGFCIRNSTGNLIYAQGEEIREGTNLEAEAIAIREALAHCVTEGIRQVCLEQTHKC